jgi:putative CocE/NonD family hydrolase
VRKTYIISAMPPSDGNRAGGSRRFLLRAGALLPGLICIGAVAVAGRATGAAAPAAPIAAASPDAARPPGAPAPPPAAPPESVQLVVGVKIPLRDGVRLGATLYLPAGAGAAGSAAGAGAAGNAAGAVPVVFRMTPYIADGFHPEALYLARRGFAVATVDVRGRGNSEGRFEPWIHDGRDGYDVAEWLARQSWANGKVGMVGESYCGRAVWSTLKEAPPHLASAVPIAAGSGMRFWNDILGPDTLQSIVQTAGVTGNQHLAFDAAFWAAKYRELYLRHLPLRQLDVLAGFPSEIFQRFLDHPTPDAFWESMVPGAEDFRRMRMPILTITGAYDINQAAALHNYREHRRATAATAPAAARSFLLLGPWEHAATLRPRREVGGVDLGPASLVDMPRLLADWFTFSLRGGPPPPLLAQGVAYYVIGADAEPWRQAGDLDAISGAPLDLYLASDGDAGSLFHSGRLTAEPPGGSPAPRPGAAAPPAAGAALDRYVYDPLDVRPAASELEEVEDWVTDQRQAVALHGDGLVFHGAPLPRDTEIAGEPQFDAWISMDVPDADVEATLAILDRRGGSTLLGAQTLRARYRRSLEHQELVRPGAVELYRFTLPFLTRRLAAGSRLRLVVRSPNSIYAVKNYCGGGRVADESGRDARTAHIALHHDPRHPSRLRLLLARPAPPP